MTIFIVRKTTCVIFCSQVYFMLFFRIKHILSNLIFQLLIGIPLEMVHKFWRVGIVYTLGVIAGKFIEVSTFAATFV